MNFSFAARVCSGLSASLLVCAAAPSQAKPDFDGSEITAPESVVEGGLARFQAVLRNRGDEPATAAHIRIKWPVMGHVVEVSGLDDLQIDEENRDTTGSVSLPAGGERELEIVVLAPRDEGGAALSLSMQIIHYHSMAETWLHKTIQIATRKRTDGVIIGGLRIAPAGLATLGWLAVTALAMLVVVMRCQGGEGSMFSPISGVFGMMLAVGFWLVFASMAWRDYRVLTAWKESTATIVGRRVSAHSVSTTQRRSSGSGAQSRQQDVVKPEFALRYTVDGRAVHSTGYDTGSSLRRGGGRAQLEKEFREWTLGARVPCWHDPADPSDVVLKRGFGGAYLFAILPLLPWWIGWRILRHRLLPRTAGRQP